MGGVERGAPANSRAAVVPPAAGRRARRHGVAAAAADGRERPRRPAKGAADSVARLVVIEPKARRGATFPLGAEITVGRDPASTIMIDGDTFVSSHAPADLRRRGPGDGRGPRLDERLVPQRQPPRGARLLHPGDRIQVGYTVLEAQ